MENKKLGQEPAFAASKEIQELDPNCFGYNVGMSKRFYAANNYANIAKDFLSGVSSRYILDLLGLSLDVEYDVYKHYPMAIVKLQYMFADELLKQENL